MKIPNIESPDDVSYGGATGFNWDGVNKRLGLGTDAPGSILETKGIGSSITSNNTDTASSSSLLTKENGTSTGGIVAYGSTHATLADKVYLKNYNANGDIVLQPGSGGNVGIGTNNPTHPLEIVGVNAISKDTGNTLVQQETFNTQDVSTITSIGPAYGLGFGGFVIVCGGSTVGDKRFIDVVSVGRTTVSVINSHNLYNSPSTRTYSVTGVSTLQLTMTSDTYDITVYGIGHPIPH